MLKILGRLGPFGTIVLYILNWLLKLKYVLYPSIKPQHFYSTETGLFVFPLSWTKYAIEHPLLYTIFSIHTIFLFAMFVNYNWKQEKLTFKNSLLPAVSIILISSLIPEAFLFNVYTVICVFLVFALRLIYNANGSEAYMRLFFAGIILGCITMTKPSFLIVGLFIAIVILIVKAIQGRFIVSYFLGYIFPMYTFLSFIWIFSPSLIKNIPDWHFILPKRTIHLEAFILSSVTIVWLMVHTYFLKQNKSEIGGILIIKKWISLRLVWFGILIISWMTAVVPSNQYFMVFNVAAALIFQCFNIALNKKWANFTFVFLILVTLINQYAFFEA